jgi:plasmid stabilization system protein ParE
VRVVFTEAAKTDIRHILRETRAMFGALQVSRYRALISDARRRLRDFPSLGHHRYGLPPEGRLLHIGQPGRPASHFFLYRINDSANTAEVLRVLHEAMDIPAHLTGPR